MKRTVYWRPFLMELPCHDPSMIGFDVAGGAQAAHNMANLVLYYGSYDSESMIQVKYQTKNLPIVQGVLLITTDEKKPQAV